MRKIINCFVIVFLFLLMGTNCFSQKETFDIATYTPPKGWKKDANPGVVAWSNVNTTTGNFCVLAMYESSASSGDEQMDFKTEWNDRVVTPHQGDANPKTETQSSGDGWKVVTAAAPIKMEAMDAYAILAVYSGFGKKFSVLTMLNDQSYVTEIDAILKDMKLDKTATIALSSTNNSGVTNTNRTNGQFGTVMYTAPNNWKIAKYTDGDILSPANPVAGEFLEVFVHPSNNFSGTIEEAMQKFYDEIAAKMPATKMNDVNGGSYKAQPAKVSFRGWEYIRCTGGIKMGGGDYPPEYGLDLFVVKVNGRYETISIVNSRNNCGYSSYYPGQRKSYYNDIENFLFSLQFADWKEPVVKTGSVKGTGIVGVWQGISMSVGTPSAGAELGATLKVKQLIFFSNGQAFFGSNFPSEGLGELNTWARAEINRRDWGTYSFANGKGVLKLPYGDIPLRMENNKLVITSNGTDHGFIKLNEVDGTRFNGTYAMSSKTALGNETGITPLISFTADGQFTDNGALKLLYHEYSECLNLAKEPGSGTYEVKDFSILFNYSDGRKIKIAFMGTDHNKNDQSPATLTLSFNEDVLRKQ